MGKANKKDKRAPGGTRAQPAERAVNGARAVSASHPTVTSDMLAVLADSLPVSIFVYKGARIEYANVEACELVGHSLPDLRAMSFWDLMDPEFQEMVKTRELARQLGEHVPEKYPIKLIRKDGATVWVDFCAQVLQFEGDTASMGIAHDVTRQKAEALALRDRIAFEDVVRSISTSFIQVLPSDIDEAINRALYMLGEFAGVDRSYVFLFSEDGTRMSNTHEWCRPGVKPAMTELQDLPPDFVPWFHARIRRREVVYVPDVGALPPEAAAERAEWMRESIQSLVCVPLVAGNTSTGFVGFDSVRRKKTWPEDIIRLLRDFSQILVSAFQRRKSADLTATNTRLHLEVLERQRVEKQLREQSDLLQNIIANIPHSVFWKNRDSVYVGCNRNFARRNGKETVEDVVGKTDSELNPAKDAVAYLVSCDQAVMDSGDPMVNVEETRVGPDGTRSYLLTSKVPLRNSEGRVVGLVGILTDITKIKEAEEALRESEQRLQGILENAQAVIFVKDPAGRYILGNRRLAEVSGFRREEIKGKTDADFFPPESAALFRQNDLRVLETGEPLEAEETLCLPDGVHTFYSLKFPLRDENGTPYAVCGIATDISAQKRVEEALLHRIQLEECLCSCSQTLLSAEDVDAALNETLGYLQGVSHASSVRIMRITGTELRGRRFRCTHEAGDSGCCAGGTERGPRLQVEDMAAWCVRLAKGEAVRGTLETLPPAERRVLECWGVASVLLLPIRIKTELYGLLRFDDIDQSLGWREEDIRLLMTAAEMIGTFIERRRVQSELRAAKEAAESANQAKSRLLANMSHEIRTPITALMGAAELLARGDGHERPQHTDMVLSNGRHLLALVDNLLDLSGTEANKVSMNPQVHSLVDIVADIWFITFPLRPQREFEFAFLYETKLPSMVYTDATRLKQAVVNLISNALKFTDEGHVNVRFQTGAAPHDDQLIIKVEDTGIGIAKEDTDIVFESFQRAEQMHQRVVGGVGLGLPLARLIAERLGGSLTVVSQEGVGSTFSLTVDIGHVEGSEWLDPAAFQRAVQTRPDRAERTVKKQLRGRILLAEDVDDVREILQAELQTAGADVTAVGDGREAVRLARRHEYDLILMDVRMPHMDGPTATRELRKHGLLTPIIALTANSTPADMLEMAKVGFDDCWAKPFSLEHLVEAASAYLLPAEADVPNTPPNEPAPPSGGAGLSARTRLAIEAFEAGLPERLSTIKIAMTHADRDAVEDALHRLAGTGGLCGHMELSKEARRVMESHASDDWSILRAELRPLIQMIEDITARASKPSG